MERTLPPRSCVCGCPPDVHEHWRAGTECSSCGRDVCPAYRTAGGISPADRERRRLVAIVIGVPAVVLALVAAAVWLGEWAVSLLLAVIGAAAVVLLIRERKED